MISELEQDVEEFDVDNPFILAKQSSPLRAARAKHAKDHKGDLNTKLKNIINKVSTGHLLNHYHATGLTRTIDNSRDKAHDSNRGNTSDMVRQKEPKHEFYLNFLEYFVFLLSKLHSVDITDSATALQIADKQKYKELKQRILATISEISLKHVLFVKYILTGVTTSE